MWKDSSILEMGKIRSITRVDKDYIEKRGELVDKLNIYVCEKFFIELSKVLEMDEFDDVNIRQYPPLCENGDKGLVLCCKCSDCKKLIKPDGFEVKYSNFCLDHFSNHESNDSELVRLFVSNTILEWRLYKSKIEYKKEIGEYRSQNADYSAIFDLVNKLSSFTNKNEVLNKIKEIFLIIFGAENFTYWNNDSENDMLSYEIKELFLSNENLFLFSREDVRICIKIQWNDKLYGAIDISGFMFPEYLDKYLNFAIEIVKTCGLIFSNIDKNDDLYIKAQYDSLNKIVENLNLGFIRLTYPDFNIIYSNSNSYKFLKKVRPDMGTKNSIRGENIFDIIDMKDRITQLIKKSLESNSKNIYEILQYKINGEEIFRKVICQPLVDLNNDISEVICIGIDVTEEEKTKIMMENSLKIQDEIYANISHELKTPLNVIFSANQLIEMYLMKDIIEENKENIINCSNSIKKNCYRQIKLINNILDLSKNNLGFYDINLKNQDIVSLVNNIIQSVVEYGQVKDLNIIFNTNIKVKILACDPIMIERALLNLISNAIKFSNPKNDIFIDVFDKGNKVDITVIDNGIGIEAIHLNHLFDRFYQVDKSLLRKSEGSGIGLSLVKRIIDLHDGNVSVESEVGKGSIFKIELPVKIIDFPNIVLQDQYNNDKIEMINIEFSDIYSYD